MKKTEKIEVRLSHEEKIALTSLAEQEGRTFSELIRDLIQRYMALTVGRLPPKKPWGWLLGMVVAGLLAGHLLTYAYTRHHAGTHDARAADIRLNLPPSH